MTDRTGAIETLLSEAEAAHDVYETTELRGAYDEAWPAWYAAYAVEHGIGDLVGRPLTANELEPLLVTAFAEFKALDPRPTESWAAWTARRIAAELGP